MPVLINEVSPVAVIKALEGIILFPAPGTLGKGDDIVRLKLLDFIQAVVWLILHDGILNRV